MIRPERMRGKIDVENRWVKRKKLKRIILEAAESQSGELFYIISIYVNFSFTLNLTIRSDNTGLT